MIYYNIQQPKQDTDTCRDDISVAALDIEPCNGSIDVLGGGHVGVDAKTEYSRK